MTQFAAQLDGFSEAAQGEQAAPDAGGDGLRDIRLIEAMYRSTRMPGGGDRAVEVPPTTPAPILVIPAKAGNLGTIAPHRHGSPPSRG